jgi:hypothetical protein
MAVSQCDYMNYVSILLQKQELLMTLRTVYLNLTKSLML